MAFFVCLEERVATVSNKFGLPLRRPALCIGIDPHGTELKELALEETYASHTSELLWRYCNELIEHTKDVADCYKPNLAFFLSQGSNGLNVLERVCAELRRRSIPFILDAKFGDVPSTAVGYASFAFELLQCGAVTVNPYMGKDVVDAFLYHGNSQDHAVFVLCKTSNPGSNDLQTVVADESDQLFRKVAQLCCLKDSDSTNRTGLVVGATDIDALASVRLMLPSTWILAPGVGAQGGNLKDVVERGSRSDGSGLLVSVSRSISGAPDKKEAALSMLRQISAHVDQK